MLYLQDEFVSYQGTGHLIGTRQYFVRFAGCSVAECPIRQQCDEPAALTRRNANTTDVDEVVERAMASVGRSGWLHITGGEPTDQSDGLQELAKLARKRGLYVHLQTSGVRRVPIQWDWLTVSPKQELPEQKFGQEMVVIDDGALQPERMRKLVDSTSFWSYYLCPLWGRDLSATANVALQLGDPWCLTLQMHKVGAFR
jgi:organic radical activating enzyme